MKKTFSSSDIAEKRKGIGFIPAALFFTIRKTGRDAREPDNIIILLPEKYLNESNKVSRSSWYDSEDKRNILFFYPGSVPIRPVGNLYEAVVNDSWGTENAAYKTTEIYKSYKF